MIPDGICREPVQSRCWNCFSRRRRCINLALGLTTPSQELWLVINNQLSNCQPSRCDPRTYGNGARAGNYTQLSNMPLRRRSLFGGGTHLVHRRSASPNPLWGCPIQRVSLPCYVYVFGWLFLAGERCSTRLYVDTSVRQFRESIAEAATCYAISISEGQRNSFTILVSFCKGTCRSLGVSIPPLAITTHTRVWELHGAIYVIQIVSNYCSMRNDPLGQISTRQHRIAIQLGS